MKKAKLIPTMHWQKRQCPQQDCIQWSFVLSTHDKLHGKKDGFPIYERTTKWKCEAGHRDDTTRLVDMNGGNL